MGTPTTTSMTSFFGLSGWSRLRRVLCLPHIGQELPAFLHRRLADLRQHAGEVSLRVDGMAFGASDERP